MFKSDDFSKCQNEQQFKMRYLQKCNRENFYVFCIETEETVKGFPDVMFYDIRDSTTFFEEFKFTKTGKIKFQPTQPAFYKAHPAMDIHIVAYNAKSRTVHTFHVNTLFDKDSRYYMNEKAEVDLNKAERLILF